MTARESYPSDKLDQFQLRLPPGMRDRIRAAAEANNRSMNAEIVAALEDKFPDDFNLRNVEHALMWLKAATYGEELGRDEVRKLVDEAEEELEAFKRRLIRGDRGGIL